MHIFRYIYGYFVLPGFNFAIKKTAYKQAGEFDPKTDGFEDIDLSRRVQKVGKIMYIPLPVTFSARRFQQSFWRGILTYILLSIRYGLLKEKTIHLSNPRQDT